MMLANHVRNLAPRRDTSVKPDALLYLAQPYSHPDKAVKEARFRAGCKAAARFMNEGYSVFSPIAHSHAIETQGMDSVRPPDFWLKQDFAILKNCNALIVLMLPGWEHSHGIKEEVSFAMENAIPTYFLEVNMNQFDPNYFDVEDFIDTEDASSAAVLAALDGSLEEGFVDDYFDLGEIVPGIEDLMRMNPNEACVH